MVQFFLNALPTVNEIDVRNVNFLNKMSKSDNALLRHLYNNWGKYCYDILCSKYNYCNRLTKTSFKDAVFHQVFYDLIWMSYLESFAVLLLA